MWPGGAGPPGGSRPGRKPNSKSEARNPKEIQIAEVRNHLVIVLLSLFRISSFGFRICSIHDGAGRRRLRVAAVVEVDHDAVEIGVGAGAGDTDAEAVEAAVHVQVRGLDLDDMDAV